MNVYLYQHIIATPILLIHIIIFFLLLAFIFKKQTWITVHLKKYGMVYALIAALAAFFGSLGFSEGFHYEPCKLCWIQRIFHYPQLLLFAIALYRHDVMVWTYSLWLSTIGFIIASYQVLIQFNPAIKIATVCSTNPSVASCSTILIQAYGYITIPVMSMTLFACFIILAVVNIKK